MPEYFSTKHLLCWIYISADVTTFDVILCDVVRFWFTTKTKKYAFLMGFGLSTFGQLPCKHPALLHLVKVSLGVRGANITKQIR